MMAWCLSEGLGLIPLWPCIRLCHLIVALPGHISYINITKKCPCNIQRFFTTVKMIFFLDKKLNTFLIFAQNIDCGNTLEPPQ